MPRISPSLFIKANKISPHLRALLPATRDLASARNELRWIRDHVNSLFRERELRNARPTSPCRIEQELARLCRQRGRGVPLQYVLGSQPFGHLNIACEQGILAPRPETEAWAQHLGELIRQDALVEIPKDSSVRHGPLRIVDFCTGTGCIALSLFHSLQGTRRHLHIRGVDISPQAVALSKKNLGTNTMGGVLHAPEENQGIVFEQASVFDDEAMQALATAGSSALGEPGLDILVSNPPYISRDVWENGRGQMGYSVKKYEPRLALVPEDGVPSYPHVEHEDVFYWRLLNVADILGSKAVIFEIGDEAQAIRVASMALRRNHKGYAKIELWRDWPEMSPDEDEAGCVTVQALDGRSSNIEIKGSGNARCVVITRWRQ